MKYRGGGGKALLKVQPDAVLFDWDNTLLDHDHVVKHFERRWLEELATPPYPSHEELHHQWAESQEVFYERFFPGVEPKTVMGRFRELMAEVPPERVRLFPGAKEILDDLREKGVPMAIVSNKADHLLQREVKMLGLEGYFQVVRGVKNDHEPKKPDPTPLLETLKAMKVPLGRVWMVGDMTDDSGAARSDGFQRFAVLERHRTRIKNTAIGHDPEGGIIYLDRIDQLAPYVAAVLPKQRSLF